MEKKVARKRHSPLLKAKLTNPPSVGNRNIYTCVLSSCALEKTLGEEAKIAYVWKMFQWPGPLPPPPPFIYQTKGR